MAACPCCGQEWACAPGESISRRARRTHAEAVGAMPEDAWRFFDAVLLEPAGGALPTSRGLARDLGVHPTTLSARLGRAGLPTIKDYLGGTLVLRVAERLAVPRVAFTRVAIDVGRSTPQSLHQTIRRLVGMSGAEMRHRFPPSVALAWWLDRLVTPYAETWRTFHPLAASRRVEHRTAARS